SAAPPADASVRAPGSGRALWCATSLAAAFVVVPFLPDGAPGTTGWLAVALVLAFACIAALAAAALWALAGIAFVLAPAPDRRAGRCRVRLRPRTADLRARSGRPSARRPPCGRRDGAASDRAVGRLAARGRLSRRGRGIGTRRRRGAPRRGSAPGPIRAGPARRPAGCPRPTASRATRGPRKRELCRHMPASAAL